MKSKKQELIDAQNEQVEIVASHRVAVLKSLDELESFNGKDDYTVGLPIIVNAYPEGISQTKVREVLPDASSLAKAVKELKGTVIDVAEISSRYVVFKPLNKPADQTPKERVESVDTNPTGDPNWETLPPAAVETQKMATTK